MNIRSGLFHKQAKWALPARLASSTLRLSLLNTSQSSVTCVHLVTVVQHHQLFGLHHHVHYFQCNRPSISISPRLLVQKEQIHLPKLTTAQWCATTSAKRKELVPCVGDEVDYSLETKLRTTKRESQTEPYHARVFHYR